MPALSKDGNDISAIKLFDCGDLKVKNIDSIESSSSYYFDFEDKFKFFYGGDHSISIGLYRNFVKYCSKNKKTPVIIHIDAHPDICDFYDGSFNSHACPIKRAIDLGVETKNINLIGIRGFEKQEVEYFEEHPEIKVYTATNINENGIDSIVEEIIKKYSNKKYEIYLSYDIDANDPSFAPGTGTPEAFGLNSYLLLKLILKLIEKLNINFMDMVEVSPPLDNNNITSWLALKTLYEIFEVLIRKYDFK